MSSLDELLDAIHKHNSEMRHEKEWEKLRDRIMSSSNSKDYWFMLLNDVEAFLSSSAPKEEKKKLQGYTERLAIMIDSFNRTH